eukprot:7418482-Pyramimonas_sp.AAC.1
MHLSSLSRAAVTRRWYLTMRRRGVALHILGWRPGALLHWALHSLPRLATLGGGGLLNHGGSGGGTLVSGLGLTDKDL